MGLEFLQCLGRIVHKSESGCLSTTILSLQTKDVDLVLVGLVHLCKLATEFIFGDVGAVWVEDITIRMTSLELVSPASLFPSILLCPHICQSRGDRIDGQANLHDHLLAAEKRVSNELARTQGNRVRRHAIDHLAINPLDSTDKLVSSYIASTACIERSQFTKCAGVEEVQIAGIKNELVPTQKFCELAPLNSPIRSKRE